MEKEKLLDYQDENYLEQENLRKLMLERVDNILRAIESGKKNNFIQSSSKRIKGKFRLFYYFRGSPKMP